MTTKIRISNPSEVIRRYQSGESILSLSRDLGFSRTAITGWLRREGVELRSPSEQETLKWRSLKLNPSAVKRQLEAAWKAKRGRKRSLESRIAHAQTNYRNKSHVHYGEDMVGAALSNAGFHVEYQYPVGTYSIDIALVGERVAVEVVGSNWHPHYAEHLNRRTEYLLSQGWLVVFVLIWRKDVGLYRPRNSDNTFAKSIRIQPAFDPRKVAQHVAGLIQRLERGEGLHGKFGIITGNGYPVRTPRVLSEHLPRVARS